MEVVISPDAGAAGAIVAGIVADMVADARRAGRDPVLGVATGSSPLPAYRELVARHRDGALDVDGIRLVLLDEYVGLPTDHPQRYRRFVVEHVATPLGIVDDHVHAPDVDASDLGAAGAAYESLLAGFGGVDLQLLGVGADGHVGFNEPGSSLCSRTRIKTLTSRTRTDNARFFASIDDVPHHVMTQGLATIGDARHVVLVACGPGKAAPVAAAVEGALTASCPASVLQLHPHATVVLDEAAATALANTTYYREAHAGKPAWQRY